MPTFALHGLRLIGRLDRTDRRIQGRLACPLL